MPVFSRSSNLIFIRPVCIVAVTVIIRTFLVKWVSSLRITCPYHFTSSDFCNVAIERQCYNYILDNIDNDDDNVYFVKCTW